MPKVVNPRYVIDVTWADIDAAGALPDHARSAPYACPIGRAVARAVGVPARCGDIDVDVDGVFIAGRATDRLRRASGPLPYAARRFIREWDEGLPVEPIRFRIAIKRV